MMNTFSKFVLASAVVAAAAFTSIPAMAAAADSVNVNVPFSFTVHGKSLPAGTYQVRWDDTGNIVTMQNGSAIETFLWNAYATPKADPRVTLKFKEQGQDHVLQSIQYGAMTTPRLTPKTRKNEETAPSYAPMGQ